MPHTLSGSWLHALLLVALALPAGCIESRAIPSALPPVGATRTQLVGPEGADIAIADLHVVVPPGALATETSITVRIDAATDVPFTAYSSRVHVEPAGLAFAVPIELRVPFQGDPALATGFVAASSGAWAPRLTDVRGDVAILEMSSLRSTFVGAACEGASCRCEPRGLLDLLVVMDESPSMTEEQALLQSALPELFRALASGDLDGDGVQELPAFDDVRVGITTSDLGTGSAGAVPGCGTAGGDEGILRSAPGATAVASCAASYDPAWATYASASSSDLGGFVAQISCEASLGSGGCGFEQQLEAALLALTPSGPTAYTAPGWTVPTFPDGRVGQGDLSNAGFLREGSLLAVLVVTDEDDCSAQNSAIFSTTDARYASTLLNLRCQTYGDDLMSVDEIVSQLVGLRPGAEDLVVGAITGVPLGVATGDFDALLADPAMQIHVDPTLMDRVLPACASPNGLADPARRLVGTLAGVERAGGRAVLQSICEDSFRPLTDALVRALAARAGGSC